MQLKSIWIIILLICFGIPNVVQAQVMDTLSYKPKVAAFIIPTVFIGYGLVSLANKSVIRDLDHTTKDELQEDQPLFVAHLDDYMQFAPAAAVYGLHLAGIQGKHSFADAIGLYILSEAIMGVSVHGIKNWTHRLRPNGSGFTSFPSGHTANAFVAAEFLNQEYKDVSPWYGVSGYAVATATGVLRMYNNKHWFSDVVAGAGIGILSTKLTYLVYPYIKRKLFPGKSANMVISPGYQNGSMNFNLIKRF